MVLLISKHRSYLHIQHLGYVRRQLIRIHILIVAVEAEVAPDDIFCSVKVSAGQIVLGHIYGRYMVSVHDQNHRFVIIAQGFCKLSDEIIHLMYLIDIIFKLPLQFF